MVGNHPAKLLEHIFLKVGILQKIATNNEDNIWKMPILSFISATLQTQCLRNQKLRTYTSSEELQGDYKVQDILMAIYPFKYQRKYILWPVTLSALCQAQ